MPKPDFKIEDPEEQKVTPGRASPHPGAFVKHEVLAPFGLKVAPAAKLLGVNRANFIEMLEGRTALTRSMAYKLEALTGIDADLLIGMQAAHDRWKDHEERLSYRKTITRLSLPAEKERAA